MMASLTTTNWHALNQRSLAAALANVRRALQRHVARIQGHPAEEDTRPVAPPDSAGLSSALDVLCANFGLSSFERDILLLCAGVEMDASFPALCAAAQGDPQRAYPTFSLALAALPNAHWSALTPTAPLRHWHLIEPGAGSTLTLSPLRIDEPILHYLAGTPHLDTRLSGLVDRVPVTGDLVPSHQAIADKVVAVWSRAQSEQPLPVIQLSGNEPSGKRALAEAGCTRLGLQLYAIDVHALPTSLTEIDTFSRLWEREAILSGSALLINCDDLETTDPARVNAVTRMVERARGALIITSRERLRLGQRPTVAFEVRSPSAAEQRVVWRGALGAAAERLNGQIDLLVSQFNLGPQEIQAASATALHASERGDWQSAGDNGAGQHSQALVADLWEACRLQARPKLDDLAQRIETTATWDDLVLPVAQRQILRDVAAHVRRRAQVYNAWGFAGKSARGLGISALFAGASGTGKTTAAEVLAHELRLDLYRIDLSAVVSKYIGETEKNLRRIFDAAEAGGTILLFDEADALFGKRSDVKDSHDRYANIEVSYLLQRMEAYRGLAILTTNLKNALDTAFLRRIRFIVQFPFPDAAQRAEIWQRIFPGSTPTEGLDFTKLARLNVAGGNIRNIALNAAFLAADEGAPVQMRHILRAARSEYAKLEKPLTEAEIAGWVE